MQPSASLEANQPNVSNNENISGENEANLKYSISNVSNVNGVAHRKSMNIGNEIISNEQLKAINYLF